VANFDFVADEGLRTSLESDAAEMATCLEMKAYKAAHVLAGSIVEAMLVDHLDSTGYKDPSGKGLLTLDLGQLITAARGKKVLSERAANLASVVKHYRNLIHPGRMTRLAERIDANTANVAKSLVEIVAAEVAQLRQGTYGNTAQQVVSKVENDSSSVSILADLLRRTKPRELELLLIRDLPARYLELAAAASEDFGDPTIASILARFRRVYRAAFWAATPEIRGRVVADYARILREEVNEFEVLTREAALFQAEDLAYLPEADLPMAKEHLLSRVGRILNESVADALVGIGRHCDERELTTLIDAYVRYVSTRDTPQRRKTAGELMQRLYSEVPPDRDSALPKRLEDWERTFAERNPDLQKWLAAQRGSMSHDLDELPF
jgi:hypothetical protein